MSTRGYTGGLNERQNKPTRTGLRFRLRLPSRAPRARGRAANATLVTNHVYGADPRTVGWVHVLERMHGRGQGGQGPNIRYGMESGNGIGLGGRYAGDLGPVQKFAGAAPFLGLGSPTAQRHGMGGGPSSQAAFPSSNRIASAPASTIAGLLERAQAITLPASPIRRAPRRR